ncbi:MAG: DUF420 domain-containing protein [Nitrospirae bacterium]|nr:MAG: DUF420 domain-containing protein [Nitrospirota bacterium]
MLEWLKQPGFFGTHATVGADMSQLMATVFTGLFVIGWIQARRRRADAHHWMMLSGMIAMLAFFISYYLFRQLGVLAFEGKEGFGGSEALYHNVFIPLLITHIILVVIGLVMAVYMIVLGFRAQLIEQGRRILSDRVLQTTWGKIGIIFGALCVPVAVYLLYLVTADRFRMGRLLVWVGFLALIAIVFAVEMTIQRLWPDGGQRHRTLGRFTMTIYCILFVTGTTTYTMLYILYPGKIG